MARPGESQPLYADDSDQEAEQETPRPQRTTKKRLSDVHDVSFADSPPRQPLKSRNINDDTAEKRRRRKSTKITIIENAQAGPSNEPSIDAETSRTARQKQPLNSVAAPVVEPRASLEILSSNFDEWMKMATDNKINAGNSWNFALIDYFHDMSLLRNDDGNSINFQRASCTLDGCVKIWTSRVDSVGTETGKLLSNLANDGKDEDDDGNGSDNPDEEATAKKKKSHRPAATLAKDPAQLRSKKLDLEFSVDPLFKKTCADFDEGGAQGLLMNHLSLGTGSEAGLRVIFDASDSVGKVDEEGMDEPEDVVDLTELRNSFLPDLAVLKDKEIAHSLADFSFSRADGGGSDDTTFFQDNTQHFDNGADDDDDDNDAGPADYSMNVDENAPPVEDFFVGDDAVADDYGADMMGGDDYGGENQSHGSGMTSEQGMGQARPAGIIPFDPRRPPNELVMAMTDADGDGGMMDYFDKNFSKNWAGPEHWKMRKVIRRPDADASAKQGAKPRREKKEAFKLDFSTPAEKDLKELTKELFAPVTKGAGINLPGTGPAARKSKKKGKEKEKKDDHSLPDDMHFSSRQLVSLFLKPKFQLKMRGHKVRYNEDGDGEVDENFWAQAAADQAAGRDGNDDEDASGGAIPFNTQFFHDDYDDGPGFDDGYDDGEGGGAAEVEPGEQDLLAATQGKTRRVKPEFVNYAKRAKRVDVRKLKDNIWKGLDIVVPQSNAEDSMDVDPDEPTPTDPSEARVFSSVIAGLQQSYPKDKMEEISTSFCFICLLHLANEQGLKLESTVDDDSAPMEIEEDVKKVGNIWDLKIYRDPDATQSA
ncbi:condensin complex subunit 2/barren [Mycena capillaripes]|nr:condensin complex subunit 2/barren [Mycena capillaripes]